MKRKSSHQQLHVPAEEEKVDPPQEQLVIEEQIIMGAHAQVSVVDMIYKDLAQLIRDRFIDDVKSVHSKMNVRTALANILADLDKEIEYQHAKLQENSEDSTNETSHLSPGKNDSDPDQKVDTFTLQQPEQVPEGQPVAVDDDQETVDEEMDDIEFDDETGLCRLF
jgi:hypothetical protein